jgi:signal transduction histidine kinase
MESRRSWRVFAIGLTFALSLTILPEGKIVSAVATIASVAVVGAVVAGVRQFRPRAPVGWYLLAAACPTSALSEFVQIFDASPTVVSVTDGIATGGSLLVGCIGIALLARQRGRAEWNPTTLLDYFVIVVAGSVFTFDAFLNESHFGFQQSASLAGCIAAIGVMTLVVRMLSNKRSTFVSRSLAFVVIFGVLSGALSTLGITAHSLPAVTQILTEYCVAMAALHPAMTRLSEPVERSIQRFTVVRAVILAAALLVTTADAAVVMYRMSNVIHVAWLAGSIAIALAVGMRVRMLLAERDEARHQQEAQNAVLRVLTRAGEQLSSAMSTDDAIATATSLAKEVVGGDVELVSDVSNIDADEPRIALPITTDARAYGGLVTGRIDGDSTHEITKEFLGQLMNMLTMSLLRIEAEDDRRRSHKLQAVGSLAGGLAHELNSPLQYLRDNISYLHDAFDAAIAHVPQHVIDADDDLSFMQNDVSRAADQTLEGLQRAADIVRAMRTVGETKSNDVELVDVNRLVGSVVTLAQGRLSKVGHVQHVLRATQLVTCNASELSEVLVIILTNAVDELVRVHGEGSAVAEIRIETHDTDGQVRIDVIDNGDGIPADMRERIWDQFFTTKAVGSGAGLGLSIARSLVEQMRGTITFSSGDSGTTFSISLPST